MRGHGTALAHLLFLAARRRPHEFGLHGCLLRSHPLTLPTAPISFNFLAVNDIVGGAAPLYALSCAARTGARVCPGAGLRDTRRPASYVGELALPGYSPRSWHDKRPYRRRLSPRLS